MPFSRSGMWSPRAIGSAILAVGLGILGVLGWKYGRLICMGRHAEGVITQFWLKPGERSWLLDNKRLPSTRVIGVRFTLEGETVTDFTTSGQFGYHVNLGEEVQVVYLEDDPTFAEIDSTQQFWLPLALGSTLSAACFGAGIFLLRRKRVDWRAI